MHYLLVLSFIRHWILICTVKTSCKAALSLSESETVLFIFCYQSLTYAVVHCATINFHLLLKTYNMNIILIVVFCLLMQSSTFYLIYKCSRLIQSRNSSWQITYKFRALKYILYSMSMNILSSITLSLSWSSSHITWVSSFHLKRFEYYKRYSHYN